MSAKLKERLIELRRLLKEEQEGEKDPRYISDLNESIAALERRIEADAPAYVRVT